MNSTLALGMIEVRGRLGAVEGLDASLKAANVSLVSMIKVGGALTAFFVEGDTGAVKAAVDAVTEERDSVIDEITHIPYEKFKYLVTCNRNGVGLHNRIWGTCNPDPDSWVRKFIDWWIGPDGFPIPERDCKLRYCFMDGDSPDTIYWGDTPEEVYEQWKRCMSSARTSLIPSGMRHTPNSGTTRSGCSSSP